MKKQILLLIAAMLLMIPAAFAPVWYGSGDDTGLVGKWSCEGNFLDSSGQGNNGTQSGGVTITSGVKGRACGFDGVDSYVNLNSVVNLTDDANWTVTAWIKTNFQPDGVTYPGIFGNTITTGQMERFQYNPVYGLMWVDSVNTNSTTDAIWAKTLNIGQYYFVALTADATTANLTLYVDGVSQGQQYADTGNTRFNIRKIGSRGATSGHIWNGSIDEVRIYNRSLTASEVLSLYNTSKTAFLNIYTTPTRGLNDETGLVGYWKMNRNDGSNSTTAIDSSGNGNAGTIYNGATFTNEGRFKEAYKMDGNNDYVRIPHNDQFANPTGFTVSVWANNIESISSEDSFVIIENRHGLSPWRSWQLSVYKGKLNLRVFNSTLGINDISTAYSKMLSNRWYHIVGVFNGTNMFMYVDGLLNTSIGVFPGVLLNSTDELSIGGAIGTSTFNGTIDEVRIYNRSLSASEIAALYNGTKTNYINIYTTPTRGLLNDTPTPTITDETGLVGHWKMDDYINGNTTDSSGEGNDGVISGATTTDGRWNNAYDFTGSNEINTSLTLPDNGSISLWYYATEFANYRQIFDNSVGINLWEGWVDSSKIVYGRINTATDFKVLYDLDNIGGRNEWYHFVYTWEHSSNPVLTLYVNGVNVSVDNGTWQAPGTFNIGAGNSGQDGTCNGTIDEVKIYNRTLSASEVKELYLSKGLVGYWKMDASTRNTTDTYDSSGYNNYGKINGAVLTNEGKFKEGYKFDGVNDYINAGNSASMRVNESITVSAWAKPSSMSTNAGGIVGNYDSINYPFRLAFDGTTNKFSWKINDVSYVTSYVVPLNQWYHVVGTYDMINTKLYINGVENATSAYAVAIANNSKDVTIGYVVNGARYFNGTIDEVRIYNRALTSTEIAGLYNGTKTNYINIWSVPG